MTIEGINYYPRKKKNRRVLKTFLLIIFLITIATIGYFYINNASSKLGSEPTLIVIENPEDKIKVTIKPEENKPIKEPVITPSVEENLDKVIQNYNNKKNASSP